MSLSAPSECLTADSLPLEQLRSALAKEQTSSVPPDYLQYVACVFSAESRQEIIEWMSELSRAFKLQPEALANAVCNLDRFVLRTALCGVSLCPSKVALCAATALLLASKQFHTHPVPIALLCSAGRGAFSESDLREMEVLMLQYLEWRLLPATSYSLMNLLLQCFPLAAPSALLHAPLAAAEQLVQLTLRDAAFFEFPASITGLACVACSLHSFGMVSVVDEWLGQINQLMEIPMDIVSACYAACSRLFSAYDLLRAVAPPQPSPCPSTTFASPSESPTVDTQDMPVDVEFSSFLRTSQSDISIVSLCSRSESAFSDTRSELLSPQGSHFGASSPCSQFGLNSSHAAVKCARDSSHDAFESATYVLKDCEMTSSDPCLFTSIEGPTRAAYSSTLPIMHPIAVPSRTYPEPFITHGPRGFHYA